MDVLCKVHVHVCIMLYDAYVVEVADVGKLTNHGDLKYSRTMCIITGTALLIVNVRKISAWAKHTCPIIGCK